ncbi:hypothetical protein FGB62_50g211 [Gracilaria domingensis]|nr:hypothetical protein FGB62_50g211 [Gracilaria domingensis]
MVVVTNIDVSVFNIVKYLILNIVIDVIVRRGLDGLEHFRRRLSLYRGRSVSVSGLRIDRYNLLGTFKSGQVLFASFLFAVTVVAYTVEVGLEYAVDSRAIRYPSRGNITRVQYETGVCSVERLDTDNNFRLTALIAEQCVTFVDGIYRFYKPVWTSETDNDFGLLCEAVERNQLYEGRGVYGPRFGSEGASKVSALAEALASNSHKSFGDSEHALVIINVTSSDVFLWNSFVTPEAQFITSMFVKSMPGTSVKCFGFTMGRRDRNTFLLHMLGCVDSFADEGSLIITSGTSFLDVEASQVEAEDSFEWSAQVAVEVRMRVPFYFRGIAEEHPSRVNSTAFAFFLSRSFPQDVINLNKYGIVYLFCDQIDMPIWNGSTWVEEYEFSSSEVRVTATVEEWGIALVACWAVIVSLTHLLVTYVALRKRMPGKLMGEKHLLRRWAEDNDGNDPGEEADNDAFLSVQEGKHGDYITATVRRSSLGRKRRL